MAEMWYPGAVRDEQQAGVRLDTSLPARATWHITADRLDANGVQPPFGNVAAYLKRVLFCPHIMWDPFTGYMEQYYPANVGARALSRWNEDGRHNVQVEIYFAVGVVRDGKKFNTVAETPCVGFAGLLDWMDSLGIPRTWPMGAPTFGRRDNADVWNTQGGHYGHSQVPGENHVDPGPMPVFPAAPAAGGRELLIRDVRGLYV